ncbi:MAG: glycosyltransferase [Endozoicomonas sp.]
MSQPRNSLFGCLVTHRPGGGFNGLRQANSDFLRAVIRYSTFSELHLFLPGSDVADFEQYLKPYLAEYGPDKTVRILPVHWLPDYLETYQYTVFHCGDPFISELVSLRERHGKALFPITGRAHTLSDDLRLSRMRDLILSPVRGCDAVLCSSVAQKRVMKRLLSAASGSISDSLGVAVPYKGRVELLPLGIEPECNERLETSEARAKLGLSPDSPVILCLGRLSPADKMDLHQLLFALNDLLESGLIERFQLVVAGAGDAAGEYMRSLLGQAYELNLEDHIRFEFNVDDDRKALLFQAADLFLSIADNIQESFGLAPLEAMKEGLPVILSDWNGYRDLVEHGQSGFLIKTISADTDRLSRSVGLLYPVHSRLVEAQGTAVDIEELSEVLGRLINDQQLRVEIGNEARQRVLELFSWPVVMQGYHDIVDHLVAESARITHRSGRPVGVSLQHVFGHYATSQLAEETRLVATDRGIRVLLQSEKGFFFSELDDYLSKSLIRSVIQAAVKPVSVTELGSRLPELSDSEFVLPWMMKYQLLQLADSESQIGIRRAVMPNLSIEGDVLQTLAGKLAFPEQRRSVFIKPVLSACLAVCEGFLPDQQASREEVLSSIATELIRLLDERLLQAVSWFGESRELSAYGDIIQQLGQEGGLNQLRNLYPLWFRNSRKEVFHALRMIKALVRRLNRDLHEINNRFSDLWQQPASELVALEFPGAHSKWSVVVMRLDNGEKLVYKARDLRIDNHLVGSDNSIAVSVNRWLGDLPGIGTVTLLPGMEVIRGNEVWYGYSEYIPPLEKGLILDEEGAADYHRHLGVLLGYSLLLGLADQHHLNIIPRNGVPCLIDVETVFHGDVLRNLGRELKNPEMAFIRGIEGSSLASTGLRNLWESFHTTRVNCCSVHLTNGEFLPEEPLQWLSATNNLLTVGGRHSLDGVQPHLSETCLPEMMEGMGRLLTEVAAHRDVWVTLVEQAADLELRYQPQLNLNDARKQLRDLHVSPVFQEFPDERLERYFQRLARRIAMAGEVSQRWLDESWQEPLGRISSTMASGWLRMRQPVFIRLPGDDRLFVRDAVLGCRPVSEQPFFKADYLSEAVRIVDQLAADRELQNRFTASFRLMLKNWLSGQLEPGSQMPEWLKRDIVKGLKG